MKAFYDFVGPLLGLGLEPKDLTFSQISLRGVIVFLATLLMVRLSTKRSLAEKTAFDAVLLVILASMVSRAINGTATFFASIGGGFITQGQESRAHMIKVARPNSVIAAVGRLVRVSPTTPGN